MDHERHHGGVDVLEANGRDEWCASRSSRPIEVKWLEIRQRPREHWLYGARGGYDRFDVAQPIWSDGQRSTLRKWDEVDFVVTSQRLRGLRVKEIGAVAYLGTDVFAAMITPTRDRAAAEQESRVVIFSDLEQALVGGCQEWSNRWSYVPARGGLLLLRGGKAFSGSTTISTGCSARSFCISVMEVFNGMLVVDRWCATEGQVAEVRLDDHHARGRATVESIAAASAVGGDGDERDCVTAAAAGSASGRASFGRARWLRRSRVCPASAE